MRCNHMVCHQCRDQEAVALAEVVYVMLDACQAALKGHGRVHEDWCSIGPDCKDCSCHVSMLQRAIAKGEKALG